MDHGQVALIEKRFERLHRRVKSEESVQLDQLVLRDRDGRPKLIVVGFRMRHHNIEAISGPALKDDDQLLALRLRARGLSQYRLPEETPAPPRCRPGPSLRPS